MMVLSTCMPFRSLSRPTASLLSTSFSRAESNQEVGCVFVIWEPNRCRRPESFATNILGSKAVKNYHLPTLTQSFSL
jgi:hypothetical protein